MFKSVVVALLFVFALAGAVINFHLSRLHTSKAERPGWFQGVCTPESRPGYDCTEALKTKWAEITPRGFVDPDAPDRLPGIPVAFLGLFYFSGLAGWFLLIGRPDHDHRIFHQLLLVLILVGCAVSAFFMWVIFYRMEVKCQWCIVAHALNFTILVGTLLVSPRRPKLPTDAAPASASARPPAPGDAHRRPEMAPAAVMPAAAATAAGYPSPRHLLAAALCILAVLFGEWRTLNLDMTRFMAAAQKHRADGLQMEIDRMLEDTETQFAMFQAQTPADLKLRPDDPRRASGQLPLPVVVFSDFQCPMCRKFAERLDQEISPQFDNLLAVYWKHYPLDSACNPVVARSIHPHACQAAFAAEAARLQGGNDAFWAAHDKLFARQRELSSIDYAAFARDLGLDPERFVADMQGEPVKQRVAEDIALARATQVTATPTVFVWNRRVRNFMFENKPFLDELKKAFLTTRARRLPKPGARPEQAAPAEESSPADLNTNGSHAEPAKTPIPDNPSPPDVE